MDPVRTCVGCRRRSPRATLLRIVAVDSHLVIDGRASMPGRGCWVHDTASCLETALRRRAFVRALRVSGPLDTQTIEQHLQRKG